MYSRCQKCGKKLTDPDSMKRGYGPECWASITGISADTGEKKKEKQIEGQMSFSDIFDIMGGSDDAEKDMP